MPVVMYDFVVLFAYLSPPPPPALPIASPSAETRGTGDPMDVPSFGVEAGVDPSLADLVARMLPLADCYLATQAFVEAGSQYDQGTSSHSLEQRGCETMCVQV